MTDFKAVSRKLKKNLNILKEREAKYGRNVPLELVNQIEDHERAISLTAQVEAGQLAETEWREVMKPLLVAIESRTGDVSSGITVVRIGDVVQHITNVYRLGADLSQLEAKRDKLRQTLKNLADMAEQGLPIAEAKAQTERQLVELEARLQNARGPEEGYADSGGVDSTTLHLVYLHRLVQQTKRLSLAGLDPKAAQDEGGKELQLSAVYTALLTQQPELSAKSTLDDSLSARQIARSIRRLSALEMLNNEAHLALLGDPGSGKSTFVNFVTLCLAGEILADPQANLAILTTPIPLEDDLSEAEKSPPPQPWEHGALLPVRIVLRDLAARGLPEPSQPLSGDTLWQFIVTELGQTLSPYAPFLKKTLQEQGGLILLDGLDEVPDAYQRRMQVKQVVQHFAAEFPRCRMLVTSRTYAYQRQDWKLEGFSEAALSPFKLYQITRFIDRWYEHLSVVRTLNAAEAQGRAALLKTAVEHSKRLAELASRPLLLTLMASLHAWHGGSLPEHREKLYANAVELLLEQWESPKVVRDATGRPLIRQPSLAEWLKVERDAVRTELNRLAFEVHRDQPQLVGTADIAQERLVSALLRMARNPEVNPVRLVEYIRDRAGLLVERGEGVYTFPHRTFQEYLAACHLTNYGFPDQLAELFKRDPQRWRESVLLAGAKAASGTSSAAWNLAEALCFRSVPDNLGSEFPRAEGWGALLAAQTLLENQKEQLAQVSERNAPKLALIRDWLQVIVNRGWLPPQDRALAGQALAVLGDSRDFDELITVPGGSFLMGEERSGDAKPPHRVTLPAFQIGKFPVTNAQYRCFINATDRVWQTDQGLQPEQATCPAVNITWREALAYCEWLTSTWSAEGKLAANQIVRLPTEAEWEKAACGPDGRTYPWGKEWDMLRCNTSESGPSEPTPVGIYPTGASPFGCLDMAGNVWEWTSSLWGVWTRGEIKLEYGYPYDPNDGRENIWADDNTLRVLRGGSYTLNRSFARCAFRFRDYPYYWSGYYGFRIVVATER